MMKLTGKTREQMERLLQHHSRDELVSVIFSLVTVEQFYKPAEIAARSRMSKRTVLDDIHAGKFGGEFFKRSDNQLMVSASGVNAWRNGFRVRVNVGHNGNGHS
jgi:hypothetical protein